MPATPGGTEWAFNPGPGITNDYVSLAGFNDQPGASNDAGIAAVLAPKSTGGNPLTWLATVFVFLVIIKYASQHPKSKLDPKIIGVGFFNLLVVTLMSILGIAATKTLLNKYQYPVLSGPRALVNVV